MPELYADHEDHDLLARGTPKEGKKRHKHRSKKRGVHPARDGGRDQPLRHAHDDWIKRLRRAYPGRGARTYDEAYDDDDYDEPAYDAPAPPAAPEVGPEAPRDRSDVLEALASVQAQLAGHVTRQEHLQDLLQQTMERQADVANVLLDANRAGTAAADRLGDHLRNFQQAAPPPAAPAAPVNYTSALGSPRTGLQTWTTEEVAEVFRFLCYRDWGADQAAEVAQTVRNQELNGAALEHFHLEDLEKMGAVAGSIDGGQQCIIAKVGPRLVLLARLKAFRAAHAHEPFSVVRQCFDMPKHLAGAEHLTRQLADALRVPNIANVSDTRDESLRAALVHVRKPDKSKITQVVVPVFATILVKKLVEDTDGIVSLVATFIQRPLLYDLKSMDRESGNEAKVYFDMRVNEGEHFDCFTMRKVAHVLEAAPGAAEVKKGADAPPTFLSAATSTFAASLPMKLDSVYNQQPFNIMACTVMIELTSFVGINAEGVKFEMRPSFIGHASDLRNLVCVRDFKTQYKMDEMRKWELINANPTVEYEYDGGGQKELYVPKVRLTYYLFEEAMQPFLETVMPIVFAYFANSLNVFQVRRNQADFTDYLANSIAIGLTIVFIVPEISKSDSFDEKFQLNHVYVFWIFLGMIATAPAYYYSGEMKTAAVAFMWSSLLIPFYNMVVYHYYKFKLNRSWYDAAPHMTFLGRPGKADNKRSSSGNFDPALCHFVSKSTDEVGVRLHPNLIDPASARALEPNGRTMPVPWQLDRKNKIIYSGLPRHYFNDVEIQNEIDAHKHSRFHQGEHL